MWITPTTENLKSHITSSEFAILQEKFLAEGQADPLADMIAQIADEMRGYIAAGSVTLGLTGTIPQRLLSTLCVIVRHRAGTRFNVAALVTPPREKEYDEAIKRLESISEKKYIIEEPVAAASESSGGPRPLITPKTETFDPQDQDGI